MAQICFIPLIPKCEQAPCAPAQGWVGYGEKDEQGLLVNKAGHAVGWAASPTPSACFGEQNYC